MTKRLVGWAILAAVFVAGCEPSVTDSQTKFYSTDSYPATITYDTDFRIPLSAFPEPVTSADQSQLSVANEAFLASTLRLHILHLYGVFTYHESPIDFASYSGTIEESYEDHGTEITKLELAAEHLKVFYHYADRAVFYKDLIPNGTGRKLTFYMPVEPTTLYAKSMPENPATDPVTNKPIHPCTDLTDNSEAGFWYYWSPQRAGCPQSIMSELQLVDATIKVLPSTVKTFPDYAQLYANERLAINILVGADQKMDDPNDAGRLTYNALRRQFAALKQGRTNVFTAVEAGPGVYENQRYSYQTDQFEAVLTIYFVNTEDEQHWDTFARDQLIDSDILLFSGHSYEDYYFDPDRLFADAPQQMTGNRYQIMFQNSCTTWSYFSRKFFDLKKTLNAQAGNAAEDPNGTRYMDLLTNAIGAPFTIDASTPDALKPLPETILVTGLLGMNAKGALRARLPSWQTLVDRITAVAGYDYTALTNVIGDEDNPKRLAPGLTVPRPR